MVKFHCSALVHIFHQFIVEDSQIDKATFTLGKLPFSISSFMCLKMCSKRIHPNILPEA